MSSTYYFMKKILLLFMLTLLLIAGCSKEEEEKIETFNDSEIQIMPEKSINNVLPPITPECNEFDIKSTKGCCPDKNQNLVCDEIDLANEIKAEYDFIFSEIKTTQYVKVIAKDTTDGKINPSDKIKIYLKLDEKNKEVKVGEIILKMDYIGGGKTMYYNKTFGIEVYNLTYLSNEGHPIKEDYLTSSDVVVLNFNPDVSIKNSDYVYLKIFTTSGLYVPIHINTPKNFTQEETILYP